MWSLSRLRFMRRTVSTCLLAYSCANWRNYFCMHGCIAQTLNSILSVICVYLFCLIYSLMFCFIVGIHRECMQLQLISNPTMLFGSLCTLITRPTYTEYIYFRTVYFRVLWANNKGHCFVIISIMPFFIVLTPSTWSNTIRGIDEN